MDDFLRRQVDHSHSDFTVKFVLDNLGPELEGNGAPIEGVDIEPMEMGGFVSDLYRIRIHFRGDASGQKPASFSCIFKVPTSRKLDGEVKYDDETFKELVEWCFRVHNAECRFYAEAMPLVHSAPLPLPFRLPKLFAFRLSPSKENVAGGFLLMEDLCAEGKRPKLAQVGLAEGMSKEQIDSTVRGLAQFHALCLWLPPDLVNSFRLETDLNFEDHKLHILDRLLGMEDGAREFGPKRGELADLYLRAGIIQADQHKQFGRAATICHGDFWSNNLFFECADGEEGKKAGTKLGAIIDWQVVYSGTGINDLLRVFFVCADPEIRRPNTQKWLRMYADELAANLAKIGGGGEGRERPLEIIRQMAQFHCEYEVCFQIFLLTNVLGGEKEPAKRAKLIRRMGALFEDCSEKQGMFTEEE